jgi:hypothetical protein
MSRDHTKLTIFDKRLSGKDEIVKQAANKILIYLICFTFLSLVTGVPGILSEVKEGGFPIGEMVSKGDVKFEARDKVWKKVENSSFPVFKGVKIRTEKGFAAIAVGNNSQIGMGQNSLISFEQTDQLSFSQGRIAFRTPPSGKLNLRVGGLIVTSSRPLQAANGSVPGVPMSGETIGILSLSPEGALTVKNHQGNLYILNQERVVLASLSSRESVMLPSVTVKSPPRVMVAQVGEAGGYYDEEELTLLRMTVNDWLLLFGGWAVLGGGLIYALNQSDDDNIPICP